MVLIKFVMLRFQLFLVGVLFLVFACSERSAQLVEGNPGENTSKGDTLFYWFGEEFMGTQQNTIELDREITVTRGKAKIKAATHAASASHIYIYNADCVRVGTFEVKPNNYGELEAEMVFDDSTKTEVRIAFMNLYSWWNGATLKSLHFYSSTGMVTDSVWLPIPEEEEGEVEEFQMFDELGYSWTGSRWLSSEKMVLNLNESVLPSDASVLVKSQSVSSSKIIIYAFTEDNVQVGEFRGEVKEFSKMKLYFQSSNQSDTLQKVSYLECYSFGAKAKIKAAVFAYPEADEMEEFDYSEERCY